MNQSNQESTLPDYSRVLVQLIRGVIYSEQLSDWQLLLLHRKAIDSYFEKVGLSLQIHQDDGFAYLKQELIDKSDGEKQLPSLIRKIPLSFHETLLCVLLREQLSNFEKQDSDSSRLIISEEEIKDMMDPFIKDIPNATLRSKRIENSINKIAEWGYLKKLKSQESRYEVRRILKARIKMETLHSIKEKLQEHTALQIESISSNPSNQNSEEYGDQ